VMSRDGTFRFTARAHDLSDKFLLTRRRSRVIAGMLAVDGLPVSERDLLHGSTTVLTATGIHNITVTGTGNPPPFCSPGEQDARMLAPEDADGCSTLFLFAPHQHLPSRGGIAALRHCWPSMLSEPAANTSLDNGAPSHPEELRFIWLSQSPIEKNWPIWRAARRSAAACSSLADSLSCDISPTAMTSEFLFARTIEPHDIFSVQWEAQAELVSGGVVTRVAATSASTLKWLHDNTPFWIHGGASRMRAAASLHSSLVDLSTQGRPLLQCRTLLHALQPAKPASATAAVQ
jgi:hypothetical protein